MQTHGPATLKFNRNKEDNQPVLSLWLKKKQILTSLFTITIHSQN